MGVPVALSCLVLLNAPSAKLLYPSELVNVAGLFGLVFFGVYECLMSRQYTLPRSVLTVLLINALLWALVFLSVIWGTAAYPEPTLLARYAGAFTAISAICVFVRYEHVRQLAWLQAGWGGAMTILYGSGAIVLDRTLGQHYLTLGVPLAAGFVASMGLGFLDPRSTRVIRWVVAANGILCFAGLASLLGRAPVLLSFLVVALSATIYIVTEKRILRKMALVALFCIVLAVGISLTLDFLQGGWWQRLNSLLLNWENEPRLGYYATSLDLISAQPMGLGVGGYEQRFGIYPHNIFLESAVTGGVLTLAPLIVIFCMLGSSWVSLLRRRSSIVPVAMVAVYLFMTWNVSFDLGTAYIPLGYALATVIASRMENGFAA